MDEAVFYDVIHGGIDADHIKVIEDSGWTIAHILPGVFEVTAEFEADQCPLGLSEYAQRMNFFWEGSYTVVDGPDLEDGRHSWLILRN